MPVDDTTDDPRASTVPGVAHACGHDVHITVLAGELPASVAADRILAAYDRD